MRVWLSVCVLLFGGTVYGWADEEGGAKKNQAGGKQATMLMGEVKGKHVFLMLFADVGSMKKMRKQKGTRMLSVEPGCFVVESFVEFPDSERMEIRFADDGGFSKGAQELLGVGKRFVVQYAPTKRLKSFGKILAITPMVEGKKKSEEK